MVSQGKDNYKRKKGGNTKFSISFYIVHFLICSFHFIYKIKSNRGRDSHLILFYIFDISFENPSFL